MSSWLLELFKSAEDQISAPKKYNARNFLEQFITARKTVEQYRVNAQTPGQQNDCDAIEGVLYRTLADFISRFPAEYWSSNGEINTLNAIIRGPFFSESQKTELVNLYRAAIEPYFATEAEKAYMMFTDDLNGYLRGADLLMQPLVDMTIEHGDNIGRINPTLAVDMAKEACLLLSAGDPKRIQLFDIIGRHSDLYRRPYDRDGDGDRSLARFLGRIENDVYGRIIVAQAFYSYVEWLKTVQLDDIREHGTGEGSSYNHSRPAYRIIGDLLEVARRKKSVFAVQVARQTFNKNFDSFASVDPKRATEFALHLRTEWRWEEDKSLARELKGFSDDIARRILKNDLSIRGIRYPAPEHYDLAIRMSKIARTGTLCLSLDTALRNAEAREASGDHLRAAKSMLAIYRIAASPDKPKRASQAQVSRIEDVQVRALAAAFDYSQRIPDADHAEGFVICTELAQIDDTPHFMKKALLLRALKFGETGVEQNPLGMEKRLDQLIQAAETLGATDIVTDAQTMRLSLFLPKPLTPAELAVVERLRPMPETLDA